MDSGLKLPSPDGQKEQVYLIETEDGTLVNVPESRLEAWQRAQGGSGLSPSLKRQLRDRIVESVYGSKK